MGRRARQAEEPALSSGSSGSVEKWSELIGSSPDGFEQAAREVVARANRTLRGITGLRLLDKRVKTEDGQIVEYRVRMRLFFDVAPSADLHW